MKSEDLQKLVLSKYENGDETTKIFRDLNGTISLSTIERWCGRIREVGTIDLANLRGCSRTIRTKAAIQKVKRRLNRRKQFFEALKFAVFVLLIIKNYYLKSKTFIFVYKNSF
jgi:transposase